MNIKPLRVSIKSSPIAKENIIKTANSQTTTNRQALARQVEYYRELVKECPNDNVLRGILNEYTIELSHIKRK